MTKDRCPATKTIEDECCIMPLQCELALGHDSPHCTTYPGLDGDLAVPVRWADGDTARAVFRRGRRQP